MPNGLVLIQGAVSQPRPQVLSGQVSTHMPAPASSTDPLYVTIPQWKGDYYWTVSDWPSVHGCALPAQGAMCTVVIDDQQNLKVVGWDGAYAFPSVTAAAWIAPTLLNSWVNEGTGYETLAYLKDPVGFVHLKGVISGGANGTEPFVLPAGYRPSATAYYATPTGSLAAAGLAITATGTTTLYYSGATTYVGLSGITFLAEN